MDCNAAARLKQFEVLWNEIARRSSFQQALIAATVTATGAVGGIVVGRKSNTDLFAVLAAVAPIFGLLWLDHAEKIAEISGFIAKHWNQWPNWEMECRRKPHKPGGRLRALGYLIVIVLIFGGPASAGLIVSFGSLAGATDRVAGWVFGFVLTALFFVAWLCHLVNTMRRPRTAAGAARKRWH